MDWKATLHRRRGRLGPAEKDRCSRVKWGEAAIEGRFVGVVLAVALALSIALHVGLFVAFGASGEVEGVCEEQVLIIGNERPEKDEADDPLPDSHEEEARILEPQPDFEEWVALGKPKGSGGPIEEQASQVQTAENTDRFGEEPEVAEEPQQLVPEEVYGVDMNSIVDTGSIATRVGNSLKTSPGKYVDPSRVRPRSSTGGNQSASSSGSGAIQQPEAPVEPALFEPPPMPKAPPAPPAASDMNVPDPSRLKIPSPPKVVVPKKKYKNRVSPRYTIEAEEAEIEGTVVVDVWVDATGTPTRAEVVNSLGYGLDEQAIRAAMASVYNPVTRDGRTASCRYRLPYRFVLR